MLTPHLKFGRLALLDRTRGNREMKTKLTSLKGYIITDFKEGERKGSMEIWGKLTTISLKVPKPIRLMIINDFNQMFDKNGNWFEDER